MLAGSPGRRSIPKAASADGFRLALVRGRTYEDAGVSLAAADEVVERLRAAVESTGAEGFGAFAGLYPLDARTLLAASTDGVGTKLMLARRRGRLRDCGADLARHGLNDVRTPRARRLVGRAARALA